jgi:uncharacterized membrane protein
MFDNIYTNFAVAIGISIGVSYMILKVVTYVATWRIKKFTEKIIKESDEPEGKKKEDKNASK